MRIVLRVLLSLGCINLKNLCAHLQEEILTIPKHPRLAQFDESEAKLWCSKEDRFFLKLLWYSILGATSFFAVFSDNNHQKDDFWGCFGIVRISSWWWAQRFWKLMQKWQRKLKLKLPFISAPIFKISVPINKRRSWRFQNTPNNQLLGEFRPIKQPKTKLHKNCFSKLNIKPILEKLYFLKMTITWL